MELTINDLTCLWWAKDKNGIEFLTGNLNTNTKVMVLPNVDKKNDKEPDYFLYMGPKELAEDALPEKRPFRFAL